ncbi:MAG: helix-turn-helix transcriptional regulator [Desulfobacter sp.]
MPQPGIQKLFRFSHASGRDGIDPDGFERYGRREILVREGLWLSMINFAPDRPVCLAYEKRLPVVDFGFVISGNIRKLPGAGNAGETRVKSGISGAGFARSRSGTFMIRAREDLQILHLHMTLPFFRAVAGNAAPMMPPGLRAVARGACREDFSCIKPMSPGIQAVVYQLLNPPGNALPWHLYLEGKSLELLSLHLAALSTDPQTPDTPLLNHLEKDQVRAAKAHLVSDLAAPPTLNALAAHAGLSIIKLQAGFKAIYGKSVFDYFREYRMQTARTLLEKTETNVSQTAWQVGYVNVSHFSAAFKKRFGILPKHYLKDSLKNRAESRIESRIESRGGTRGGTAG